MFVTLHFFCVVLYVCSYGGVGCYPLLITSETKAENAEGPWDV